MTVGGNGAKTSSFGADCDFSALAAGRRSIRAYRGEPVPLELVRKILETARTAPSGANLQPGRFTVMSGAVLVDFTSRLTSAIDGGLAARTAYSYFPQPMPAALKKRQVEVGAALYRALGIDRRDEAARRGQFMRNYRFFDAPVGIIVSIDGRLGAGCFMDLGMAIQTLLLAAHAEGLGACGIGAMADYNDFIAPALALPEGEIVVCGIALGYADEAAPVNAVRTERLPLDTYAAFSGWSAEE